MQTVPSEWKTIRVNSATYVRIGGLGRALESVMRLPLLLHTHLVRYLK